MSRAASNNLEDPDGAGRWLATLTRDSEAACEEVTVALRKAGERSGPYSVDRHEAILLVDRWAAPLQDELLEEVALAAHPEQERGQKIASTLQAITQSFGHYYDALIESLRAVPRHHRHANLTYTTLVRRLAHLRYEVVLAALGYRHPQRWQKIHRLSQRNAAARP